jgi:hypothetical protein
MTQPTEFVRSLAARFRDEAVNIVVWIVKVAVLLVVFNFVFVHFVDRSNQAGYTIVNMVYDKDGRLGGVAFLFVFAVALYTITRTGRT